MSERIVPGYGFPIADALATLPLGMRKRVEGAHFWTGIDPAWAGVVPEFERKHRYLGGPTHIATAYPHHTIDKRVTVVLLLPEQQGLNYSHVLHELGHVLAWAAGIRGHVAKPTTDYARHSRHEAFAEALVTWLCWDYGDEDVLANDLATLDLFRRLSEVPM